MEEEMLKVSEAAKYLKVSKALIYQLISKKLIPHIRLSERRVVIRKKELDKWIESRSWKCEANSLG